MQKALRPAVVPCISFNPSVISSIFLGLSDSLIWESCFIKIRVELEISVEQNCIANVIAKKGKSLS